MGLPKSGELDALLGKGGTGRQALNSHEHSRQPDTDTPEGKPHPVLWGGRWPASQSASGHGLYRPAQRDYVLLCS